MTNGPSSYQALSRLLSSAKAFLKAVLRDLVRLPRALLDGPKPYLKALKQKDEEISFLKQQLGSSEIQSSERDQYRKELQEYINELQRKNKITNRFNYSIWFIFSGIADFCIYRFTLV